MKQCFSLTEQFCPYFSFMEHATKGDGTHVTAKHQHLPRYLRSH